MPPIFLLDYINVSSLRLCLDVCIEPKELNWVPIPNQPKYWNGIQFKICCLDIHVIAGLNLKGLGNCNVCLDRQNKVLYCNADTLLQLNTSLCFPHSRLPAPYHRCPALASIFPTTDALLHASVVPTANLSRPHHWSPALCRCSQPSSHATLIRSGTGGEEDGDESVDWRWLTSSPSAAGVRTVWCAQWAGSCSWQPWISVGGFTGRPPWCSDTRRRRGRGRTRGWPVGVRGVACSWRTGGRWRVGWREEEGETHLLLFSFLGVSETVCFAEWGDFRWIQRSWARYRERVSASEWEQYLVLEYDSTGEYWGHPNNGSNSRFCGRIHTSKLSLRYFSAGLAQLFFEDN